MVFLILVPIQVMAMDVRLAMLLQPVNFLQNRILFDLWCLIINYYLCFFQKIVQIPILSGITAIIVVVMMVSVNGVFLCVGQADGPGAP